MKILYMVLLEHLQASDSKDIIYDIKDGTKCHNELQGPGTAVIRNHKFKIGVSKYKNSIENTIKEETDQKSLLEDNDYNAVRLDNISEEKAIPRVLNSVKGTFSHINVPLNFFEDYFLMENYSEAYFKEIDVIEAKIKELPISKIEMLGLMYKTKIHSFLGNCLINDFIMNCIQSFISRMPEDEILPKKVINQYNLLRRSNNLVDTALISRVILINKNILKELKRKNFKPFKLPMKEKKEFKMLDKLTLFFQKEQIQNLEKEQGCEKKEDSEEVMDMEFEAKYRDIDDISILEHSFKIINQIPRDSYAIKRIQFFFLYLYEGIICKKLCLSRSSIRVIKDIKTSLLKFNLLVQYMFKRQKNYRFFSRNDHKKFINIVNKMVNSIFQLGDLEIKGIIETLDKEAINCSIKASILFLSILDNYYFMSLSTSHSKYNLPEKIDNEFCFLIDMLQEIIDLFFN